MRVLLHIFFQFIQNASDPHWTCTLMHRDPDIAGTFYLYCSQTNQEGIELVSVGRFISDARQGHGLLP